MRALDISPRNAPLYRGCKISTVTVKGKEVQQLATPTDTAAAYFAENLHQLIHESANPAEEWAEVELTGAISPWAYLTALAILTPYLKRLVHNNGRERIEIPIRPVASA